MSFCGFAEIGKFLTETMLLALDDHGESERDIVFRNDMMIWTHKHTYVVLVGEDRRERAILSIPRNPPVS